MHENFEEEELNERLDQREQELIEEAEAAVEEAEAFEPFIGVAPPKISVANQEYLRNNYKKVDLTTLCANTGMSPEDVTMYLEAYEMYVKQSGGSTNERVNFIVSVDENGYIGFGLQWPNMDKAEKILPHLGKAMYILNEGKIKQQMLQFLIRFSEEKGAYHAVKSIIEGWQEQENHIDQPIVQPHEVFGNGGH